MELQRILWTAALALAAGTTHANDAAPCDGLDREVVSRALGRTLVRQDPHPAYQQARYAVHACDWRVEGKDHGLLVVVVREAADEHKNGEDIRLLEAMAPYSRDGSHTHRIVGLGDYAHYAFNENGGATILIMQGTRLVNITAWHLGRFGAKQRAAFMELGRRAMAHALRAPGAKGAAPEETAGGW